MAGDNRPRSSADARAPFLRLVQVADAPAICAADNDAQAGNAPVICGGVKPFIDPRGASDSYFMRVVAWQQENARWALGVLEERWPYDRLGQGTPESFVLWRTGFEFNMADMAREQVEFWSRNKTLANIRTQLIGRRDSFVLADSATGDALPFIRPELRANTGQTAGVRPFRAGVPAHP